MPAYEKEEEEEEEPRERRKESGTDVGAEPPFSDFVAQSERCIRCKARARAIFPSRGAPAVPS